MSLESKPFQGWGHIWDKLPGYDSFKGRVQQSCLLCQDSGRVRGSMKEGKNEVIFIEKRTEQFFKKKYCSQIVYNFTL